MKERRVSFKNDGWQDNIYKYIYISKCYILFKMYLLDFILLIYIWRYIPQILRSNSSRF